jgi:transaldolase
LPLGCGKVGQELAAPFVGKIIDPGGDDFQAGKAGGRQFAAVIFCG